MNSLPVQRDDQQMQSCHDEQNNFDQSNQPTNPLTHPPTSEVPCRPHSSCDGDEGEEGVRDR